MNEIDGIAIQLRIWRISVPVLLIGLLISLSLDHLIIAFFLILFVHMFSLAVGYRLFGEDESVSFLASFKQSSYRFDRYYFLGVILIVITTGNWMHAHSNTFSFSDRILERDLTKVSLLHVPECTLDNRVLLATPQITQTGKRWLPFCIGDAKEAVFKKVSMPTTAEEIRVFLTKSVLSTAQQIPYRGRVLYYFNERFDWQYRQSRLFCYLFGMGWGGQFLLPPIGPYLIFTLWFTLVIMLGGGLLMWFFTVLPTAQSYWNEPSHPKSADLMMCTADSKAAEDHIPLQIEEYKAAAEFNAKKARNKYWEQAKRWTKTRSLARCLSMFPEPIRDILWHWFFG